MPGTGIKGCGGWYGGWVVCKLSLAFSLGQAEQFQYSSCMGRVRVGVYGIAAWTCGTCL